MPHAPARAAACPAGGPTLAQRLDAVLGDPERQAALELELDREAGRTCAVLIVDMCGFSRATRQAGPVAALCAVRRLQLAAEGAIAAHGGELIKFVADNVFAVFDDVAPAMAAAERIAAVQPCSAGVGYGRLLLIEGGPFGDQVNQASKLGEDEAGLGEVLPTAAAAARLAAMGEGS